MGTNISKRTEVRLEMWKNKAVSRGAELRAARKRIGELVKSRDFHKEKWKEERSVRLSYETERKDSGMDGLKPARHSYDLDTIGLCLSLRCSGSMSLRSCRSLMLTLCLHLGLELGIPCINTLRNWEHKFGYHRLGKRVCVDGRRMLIVDESFHIGGQSLLLLLSVDLEGYRFGSALSCGDAEVVYMGVRPSWKADDISAAITSVEGRGYSFAYGCSDGANNIVKSLEDKGMVRIYDCTHAMGVVLGKRYRNDAVFTDFTKRYALFNRRNYMGRDRSLCPPKLRGKCRFLNIYPMAEWSAGCLEYMTRLERKERDGDEQRIYDKLLWILGFRGLIAELEQVSEVLKTVFGILKNEGLDRKRAGRIRIELEKAACPEFLKDGIGAYLENNTLSLAGHDRLVCCSDVIESFFGKFKSDRRRSPERGITIGCLTLANYGRTIEKETVLEAMEGIRIVDIERWRKENKLHSFNSKKRHLPNKWG